MNDNSEFIQSIRDATQHVVQEEIRKMGNACRTIENDAKRNCPVDDGILRASITSNVVFENSEIIGTVGSNMEYAPYVHNGTGIYAKDGNGRTTPWMYRYKNGEFRVTVGQRPNPFLEKAKTDNMHRILQILGG